MDQSQKPLRKGAIAYIIDDTQNILISQNFDYGPNDWTFPGGGLNQGETAKQAIFVS